MTIWALSDPHLSFGVKDKSMEVFGPQWAGYTKTIESTWKKLVANEDLVLLPGDISWAMRLSEALVDLAWLDALPGTKLLLKGNHDFWWSSSEKMRAVLPPSIHFLHNSAFDWHDVTIGGARLWDTQEYSFDSFVEQSPNPKAKAALLPDLDQDEKIFTRELHRLELSLKQLNPKLKVRLAMTHYPPIGASLTPSMASSLLERYGISICVFGHLHSLRRECLPLFGEARGIRYILSSCDAINFTPIKIFER